MLEFVGRTRRSSQINLYHVYGYGKKSYKITFPILMLLHHAPFTLIPIQPSLSFSLSLAFAVTLCFVFVVVFFSLLLCCCFAYSIDLRFCRRVYLPLIVHKIPLIIRFAWLAQIWTWCHSEWNKFAVYQWNVRHE